jgi:hypothetical protein
MCTFASWRRMRFMLRAASRSTPNSRKLTTRATLRKACADKRTSKPSNFQPPPSSPNSTSSPSSTAPWSTPAKITHPSPISKSATSLQAPVQVTSIFVSTISSKRSSSQSYKSSMARTMRLSCAQPSVTRRR